MQFVGQRGDMDTVSVGTFEANGRMRELVGRVLDTGRVSYGPLSRELERRFAALHDCRFAVLSNSGTSSLQVALQALKELHGWSDGDKVLVPAVTFVATANVVLHNGMIPVLVDVDPQYYDMAVDNVEQAITSDTRAMIPVHLFGQPAQMTFLDEIAQQYGLAVIEDSCETMFVSHARRKVGSWGNVGCFSMYVAHLLTAGVGGIATTDDPELAAKMRSLVNHGRDGIYISIDDDERLGAGELHEVIARRFRFETIGHSYRITELEAALALGQLDDWRKMIGARKRNATYLSNGLKHLAREGYLQLPETRRDSEHAWMMYPLVMLREDKWGACNYLEERGIETREMLRLTDQPCYQGLWDPADYPVAQWLNERGFYAGCHQGLEENDLDRIILALYEYCEAASGR